MLARQAWRLLQNPDSLCAKLLIARYYTNGQLLEASEELGIIRGVPTLKKLNGLIWRVGDWEQIRIQEDPWIPNGVTRRHITPRHGVLVAKVSELIDPVTETWDVFWEEDATNILVIPVRPGHEDVIAWHSDPKGVFGKTGITIFWMM